MNLEPPCFEPLCREPLKPSRHLENPKSRSCVGGTREGGREGRCVRLGRRVRGRRVRMRMRMRVCGCVGVGLGGREDVLGEQREWVAEYLEMGGGERRVVEVGHLVQ